MAKAKRPVKKPAAKKPPSKAPASAALHPAPRTLHPGRRATDTPKRRATDKLPAPEQLLALDAGYQLARQNAVNYLHTRRQAVYALARRYHLEPDDIQQEGYEVLLTCLRDFTPVRRDENGAESAVQFNTFFGMRLEGKALELRNRNPEYQARQAHMAEMSDDERASFRSNPPLLVQHLDHEGTMQEHLQSEVSGAQRARQGNVRQKILQDSYIDRKLTELMAAERDPQRRAALLQVKVGGLSTFDDIAYQFGVTDSRASQILNDLMDAFYVQRLLDGDAKSIAYDFRKLKMAEKRALRLLSEAINNAPPPRALELAEVFTPDYPGVQTLLAARSSQTLGPAPAKAGALPEQGAVVIPADKPEALFSQDELKRYPPVEVAMRDIATLTPHPLTFRAPDAAEPAHITRLVTGEPEHWPLIIDESGTVIDGVRRLAAAKSRNLGRVLCHVHQIPESDAGTLRVVLNLRAIRPGKLDLYYAIAALLGQGLSQGKVAEALGTSRPNVIVYAKVAEKAAPDLRQLFEEGFIQVTNASACVEFSAATQSLIARAVRQLGPDWSKGPRFTEMFEAAEKGKLEKYLRSFPQFDPDAPLSITGATGSLQPRTQNPPIATAPHQQSDTAAPVPHASLHRIQSLESALQEAETWATRRDATIAQQTAEVSQLKEQIQKLSSELAAAQLLTQADQATLQAYLKELKLFHGVAERLQAASHHIQQAAKPLRSLQLTLRQTHEMQELCESIATHLTALRLALQRTPGQTGA